MTEALRPDVELRRAVLAFSLAEPSDLADLVVTDDGVDLPDGVHVGWTELSTGCGDGPGLISRVARWLRIRHRLAVLVQRAGPDVLLGLVRPYALPVGHPSRPGPGWAVRDVLGGAIEVGLGLRHVAEDGREDADAVGPLPIGLLRAAGIDERPLVVQALAYLEEMAELAAGRLLRSRAVALKPVGDCDVVTLLASAAYREALIRDCSGVVGLRSAAVPDRSRGWLDLGRVDPAFALAAASLTDPDRRAFSRPLLVTADEVVQVREGGSVLSDALADPLPPDRPQPIRRMG